MHEAHFDNDVVQREFIQAASTAQLRKELERRYKRDMAKGARKIIQVRIGRNDQCPCGSGKKFKKCCIGKTKEQPHD